MVHLEADAITVNGTALAEFISDTAGAMVSSNTETGIAVTYQDADNTIDFAINAAQTTITSLLALISRLVRMTKPRLTLRLLTKYTSMLIMLMR